MNLLVIAPHQDDEILSAFLLMHKIIKKNGTVNILYATNGDYRGIDYAYTRYYESLNALSLLGICEDHMLYLGYADTGMSKEKSFLMRLRSTPIIRRIRKLSILCIRKLKLNTQVRISLTTWYTQ